MGLFGKKAKRSQRYNLDIPRSREYRLFKEYNKRKMNWYETLASLSGKILTVNPGKKTKEELQRLIFFTDMMIKPSDVLSLVVCTILLFVIVGVVIFSAGLLPIMAVLGVIMAGAILAYYFYIYPKTYAKTMRIEASSQVVLAILYMVISMRISPNLERALRFAAANVTGALAIDMRRLIWDLEMGAFYSADNALSDYIARWKPENEEFAEALRLIRDSQTQVSGRAKDILDESLKVILTGTKTRMKHYAQDLKLPVMVIHMMGILLPILGTIIAPLAAVFMADIISPLHFILGYDIALPIFILFMINQTLKRRPITFSQVDIGIVPGMPKSGHLKLGGKNIPVLPIALAVLILCLAFPIMFYSENPEFLSFGVSERESLDSDLAFTSFVMSMLIILGIGMSLAVFFFLSNYQRYNAIREIQAVEGDFELALFQLGNRLAGGTPSEVAIEKSIGDMKDLKIADLFRRTLANIRNLGYTFENALFDKKYGSLRYYPSYLIRNVMYTVVETASKGVTYASEGMLRIARYLKNIKQTQEYIRDILSDTVSSMKFQAYMLSPLITGMIVSMSLIIIKVLVALGGYLDTLGAGNDFFNTLPLSAALGDMNSAISPEVFQLIVGIYLLEVIIIFAAFLTKISEGSNKVSQWYFAGKLLFIGIALYFVVAIFSSAVFASLVEEALLNLNII